MSNRMDYANAEAIFTEVGNKRRESQNGSTALLEDTVGWTGKNLLKPTNSSGTSATGITYVINENGADLDGTSTAGFNVLYGKVKLPAGQYTYTDGVETTDNTYFMNLAPNPASGSGNININSKPYNFTVDLETEFTFALYVRSGQTLSHLKFYPMVTDVAVTDSTFEPYHESVEEWGFPRSEQRVLGAWNILPYPEGFRAVIASNGTISADEGMYCSDYLRIESELFFSFTSKTNECYIRAAYYDSSYNFISRPVIDFAGSTFTKLTIPSNAKYVRFCFEDDAQSVTEPMVCISSSDLSYISHAKSNKQLTELIAPKESAVSTEKTVAYNQNFLIKSGNVVQLILLIRELTATENEAIATIPLGYRPKKDLRFTNLNSPSQFFLANTSGEIRSMQAISTSTFVSLYTTWITS